MQGAKKAFGALLIEMEKIMKDAAKTDPEYGKLKTLYQQVGSNKALVDFKLNDIDDCLAACEKVLNLEPNHEKCLYRRGLCFMTKAEQSAPAGNFQTTLNLYKASRSDLETVLRIDKSNKEVESKLTAVVRAIIKLEAEHGIEQPKVSKKTSEKPIRVEPEKPQTVQKTVKMPAGLSKDKFEAIVNNAVSQTTSKATRSNKQNFYFCSLQAI